MKFTRGVCVYSRTRGKPRSPRANFTGHEALDEVGLVHMNGRVYDPQLGWFLSADPVVQDATGLQAYNHYAYVRNNPHTCAQAWRRIESQAGFRMKGRGFMKLWGRYSAVGAIAGIAALAIDQLFKARMIGIFDERAVRKITLAPFFDLEMAWNHGISYGLLKQDSAMGQWVLVALSCAAVAALAYWLARVGSRIAALGIGLIIGGALGNAIDRARFGAVADFFAFHVGSFHWYIFNLADVAIVAGVAGLLFELLYASHKSAGKQA